MPIRALAVAVAAWATLQQAQPHRALVRHPPIKVLTWALDGLQQMGYTIQRVDTAAGTIVAERMGRLDPDVGSRFDELDVTITREHGDTTAIQITTASWTQFLQAAKRRRNPAPSERVEMDAVRLLDVLK
jgi:hypothetical protein